MSTMRSISAGSPGGRGRPVRQGGRPGGGRRAWMLAGSVLLHGAALLALLLVGRRPEPLVQPAPSYELVFENGGGTVMPTAPDRGDSQPKSDQSAEAAPGESAPDAAPPTAPPPPAPAAPPDLNLPGPTSPSPTAPPTEEAPPVPAPPPPVQAQPEPRTEAPPPPPVPEVPRQDAEPAIRLALPESTPPPPPLVPPVELPAPPPPLPTPPLPVPTPPRPAAPRPRAAPPPGSFGNPMDLSFNHAPSRDRLPPPRAGAAPGSAASRSMDLSLGAPKDGPNRSEAFFDARARNLGADWMQGVQRFWLRHRYYPRQAAENGEDGTVDLELTVDRTGRVMSAVVTSRSGSPWIDMAAVSTFRGAQLPPIPTELDVPYKTTLTISYIIVR